MRLMWRMLSCDLRSGELTVLAVALALAVAALTGVNFLADRVERAVGNEAHQLLGGDLLLTADHPWRDEFRQAAREHGLRIAETVSFPSMVAGEQGVQLAEIKAVSPEYPLRGNLRIATAPNAPDVVATGKMRAPAPGAVWPDERLAAVLQLAPGATLMVGAGKMAVTAIVTHEPDRGINPFAIAPRLLMSLADLDATGLIQPGSRARWRLHLAGEARAVADYRRWAETRLGRGERIEGLDDARPEVRSIIERTQRFLRLAALLSAILAAVAVGLAARRYMQTHLDACAMMRCLGASERQILAIHGGEFILLGLIATLAGGALGYLVQHLLHTLLTGLLASQLPAPGILPWVHGLAVGLVLVIGFVLPPLLRLKSVPTVRVLRREWGEAEPLSVLSYLAGGAALAALLFWMAGDMRLGLVVLVGFVLAILLFTLLARLLLALFGRLASWLSGGWRLGVANLLRRGEAGLVQAVALALGLTTLLLLGFTRHDLLSAWHSRVPPDAPNRFVINIQPDQRPAIADFFARQGIDAPRLEPMVRGRLARVNGRAVSPRDYPSERAQHLVEREFNLSERDDLPPGNVVAAGSWHGAGAPVQFSVEKSLAEALNLHIGDELTFDIAGQPVTARITSLRKLDWDSMRVNFFVIAPAGSFAEHPASYITSFHLPQARERFVVELVRTFPNLTVIDVGALVRQLQGTLDQAVRAVQVVFAFALFAGLTVLYAALQASAAERSHELAVLRALGARRRQLRQALVAEFATLGAVAGLLSGLMASGIGMALARLVFQLDYLPGPQLLILGALAGALGVACAGLLATWSASARRVIDGLRET